MQKIIFIITVTFFSLISFGQSEMSLSEQMIHSTVRIECVYLEKGNDGKVVVTKGTGSGFFFNYRIDSVEIPVIVTNKHVISNAYQGSFHLTQKDTSDLPIYGKHIPIALNDFQNYWIYHPDKNVDLCIMPVAPIIREADKLNTPVYYKTFDESLIPTDSTLKTLTAIEEILMIGYPIGLWDSYNNLPITRLGQTASPAELDYNNEKEFLIDIAAFPGSSGSPIILFNEGSYATENGISIGSRLMLLGILYAGPEYKAEGKGKLVIDKKPISITTKTDQPINIGIVIKSERLLDFKKELEKLLKN